MRAMLVTGLATTLGLLAVSPAFAHAHLRASTPAEGAKVAAPRAVTLTFSEGVVPRFSSVALQDAAGKTVVPGPAQGGADPATLVLPLPDRLASGTYTVLWKAVSVDTHRTQGKFTFAVTP